MIDTANVEQHMITIDEASDLWGMSRTSIYKLLYANTFPGARKAIMNGQRTWQIPYVEDFQETEWHKRFVANKAAQACNRYPTELLMDDTEESYILRNEEALSIAQLAANLHTSNRHIRAVYDRICEKRGRTCG